MKEDKKIIFPINFKGIIQLLFSLITIFLVLSLITAPIAVLLTLILGLSIHTTNFHTTNSYIALIMMFSYIIGSLILLKMKGIIKKEERNYNNFSSFSWLSVIAYFLILLIITIILLKYENNLKNSTKLFALSIYFLAFLKLVISHKNINLKPDSIIIKSIIKTRIVYFNEIENISVIIVEDKYGFYTHILLFNLKNGKRKKLIMMNIDKVAENLIKQLKNKVSIIYLEDVSRFKILFWLLF